MKASVTVDIDASAERVWAVMSEVEAWPQWTPSVRSIRRLDPGPLRVGARSRIKQPRLPPTTWTVVELVDGQSFTWTATGPGMRASAHHRDPHRVAGHPVDRPGGDPRTARRAP
jgi:uncharacterized membrane protein